MAVFVLVGHELMNAFVFQSAQPAERNQQQRHYLSVRRHLLPRAECSASCRVSEQLQSRHHGAVQAHVICSSGTPASKC